MRFSVRRPLFHGRTSIRSSAWRLSRQQKRHLLAEQATPLQDLVHSKRAKRDNVMDSESTSAWKEVEARVQLSLTPRQVASGSKFARAAAAHRALKSSMLRYNPQLNGVIVAQRGNLRFPDDCKYARLIDSSPFTRVTAYATLLLFSPAPGTPMIGRVEYIGTDHLGMNVLDLFWGVLPLSEFLKGYVYDQTLEDGVLMRYLRYTGDGHNSEQNDQQNNNSRNIYTGTVIRFAVKKMRSSSQGLFVVGGTLSFPPEVLKRCSLGIVRSAPKPSFEFAQNGFGVQHTPLPYDDPNDPTKIALAAPLRRKALPEPIPMDEMDTFDNAFSAQPTPISTKAGKRELANLDSLDLSPSESKQKKKTQKRAKRKSVPSPVIDMPLQIAGEDDALQDLAEQDLNFDILPSEYPNNDAFDDDVGNNSSRVKPRQKGKGKKGKRPPAEAPVENASIYSANPLASDPATPTKKRQRKPRKKEVQKRSEPDQFRASADDEVAELDFEQPDVNMQQLEGPFVKTPTESQKKKKKKSRSARKSDIENKLEPNGKAEPFEEGATEIGTIPDAPMQHKELAGADGYASPKKHKKERKSKKSKERSTEGRIKTEPELSGIVRSDKLESPGQGVLYQGSDQVPDQVPAKETPKSKQKEKRRKSVSKHAQTETPDMANSEGRGSSRKIKKVKTEPGEMDSMPRSDSVASDKHRASGSIVDGLPGKKSLSKEGKRGQKKRSRVKMELEVDSAQQTAEETASARPKKKRKTKS